MENLIIEALSGFNLPIYNQDVPDDELTNMHYFYFRKTNMTRSGTGYAVVQFEVAYVSTNQEDMMEDEVIEALEGKGFKWQDTDYERIRMESTNSFADIIIHRITKPKKRACRG